MSSVQEKTRSHLKKSKNLMVELEATLKQAEGAQKTFLSVAQSHLGELIQRFTQTLQSIEREEQRAEEKKAREAKAAEEAKAKAEEEAEARKGSK